MPCPRRFFFTDCLTLINLTETATNTINLVPRAFCFRGWMVSEKGPGFGWSVLQPDWSMILNVIIQYIWE
jgi:hypothetical protein